MNAQTRSSAGGMGVLRMILNRAMPSDIFAIFWPYVILLLLSSERHILVLSFVALIIFFLLSSKDSIQYNRDGQR